ncbi:MAG: hypothetical protein V1799_08830 [bacterium]
MEYDVYQLTIAQQQAAQQTGSTLVPELVLTHQELEYNPVVEQIFSIRSTNFSPPHHPPIYLMNCTLLV